MKKLYPRLVVIGLCVLASVWLLFPRTVVERTFRAGEPVYDTIRQMPLKLGLDLQGGMHLALEIDESQGAVDDKTGAIDRSLKVVRNRIDQFGVSEPIVQRVGTDRIVVELPGIDDAQRAQSIVQQSAFLQFQITDETQALEKAAARLDAILKERGITAAKSDTGKTAAANKSLFSKADTAKKDSSAKKDTTSAAGSGPFSTKLRALQAPGMYMVDAADFPLFERALADSAIQQALPPSKVLRWGQDSVGAPFRTLYVLDATPIITGDLLTSAKPEQNPMYGTTVNFKLSNEGGRKFRIQTGKHLHDYMAIVLDNVVITAPTINGAIGSDGMIELGRGRSIAEAQDLALVLNAGALPVKLKVVEIGTIGPTLGKDSVNAGIRAGLLAIALVVLVMGFYYRFSGLLAIAGLILYMVFTLAILAAFHATLTLPGLAGFVLSIGIAVDANILIFERIREELVAGKTVRLAIDEGFRHAMNAIIDSNVSTALTAVVLYQFGTGPVRGFAVTLLAGIVASLFTAIFVVRTFYLMYLSRKREADTLSIYMFRILHDTKYDFIRWWKQGLFIRIAFIVIGLGFLAINKLHFSIEFTSGTLMQVQFKVPPGADAIRAAVTSGGFPGAEISEFGTPTDYTIRAQRIDDKNTVDSTAIKIEQVIHAKFGDTTHVKVLRAEYVGPTVGAELRRNAVLAVLVAFMVTLIYLAFRFEWRFGVAAVVANAHEVLATFAFLAIMRIEFSLTVLAAILTVIGYSLNDTIIIFDRVRENLKTSRKESLRDVVNRSINETLPRSVLTHVTVFAAAMALLLFAGPVLRPFSWIMAFGVFTATFTSIYISGSLLLWLETQWPREVANGAGSKTTRRATV